MAETAELFMGYQELAQPTSVYFAPLHEVVTVHDISYDVREYAPQFMAVNVEAIAGVRDVRVAARQEADVIFESKRARLLEGDFENVDLDVDALGTAERAARVRDTYGEQSKQYGEVWEGLVMDCRRKWAEAFRKNTWEYFSETTQTYDANDDTMYAHGFSMDAVIEKGITPVVEPEEAARRTNEYINHHTRKALVKSDTMRGKATVHVSPCTYWAHESYKRNPKGGHGGYVPTIDKYMLNFDSYDPKAGAVYHEQLAVAGTYIDEEIFNLAYQLTGVVDETKKLDRSALHATIGVVSNEECSGVLAFQELLDELASQKHGKTVFMGEVLPEGKIPDYSVIKQEAEARQRQQEQLSVELAEYVMGLRDGGVENALATVMVEQYIQNRLLNIAEDDHEQAEIIFDKDTADRFRLATSLERQGRLEEAALERDKAKIDAPAASSCGGDSCGLEEVERRSTEGGKLASEIGAEVGDKIVKDMVRACQECGKKNIVYAYNSGKVIKYCTHCKAREEKRTPK